MRLDVNKSCLMIIDIQEKLNPVMFDTDRAVDGSAKLLKASDILSVPVMVTEQYPKGIGHIVAPLQPLIPDGALFEKGTFSAMLDEPFAEHFKNLSKSQVVIAGIEAHICVLQTALQLIESGFDVFVVADASASRTIDNHRAGLARIAQAGGQIVTVEMVLFEWLEKSGTPEFKAISKLIK